MFVKLARFWRQQKEASALRPAREEMCGPGHLTKAGSVQH